MFEFKKIDKTLAKAELVCTKTDGTKYDFNCFLRPLNFIENIHNCEITLDEAIEDQTKLKILINKLNYDCNPRDTKEVEEKERVLESAKKLSDARKDIIYLLKNEFFHIRVMYIKLKKKKNQRKNLKKTNFLKILRMNQKVLTISYFKHFNSASPTVLAKELFETKDEKKNND